MFVHRLCPTVQALGRGFINNHIEIILKGVLAYNVKNFSNLDSVGKGYQEKKASPESDQPICVQLFTQSTSDISNRIYSLYPAVNLLCGPKLKSIENQRAHAILRSFPAYSKTTISKAVYRQSMLYLRLKNCFSIEVAVAFIDMCHIKKGSDCSRLFITLIEKLHDLSDQQILELLKALTFWPFSEYKVYMLSYLDGLCAQRIKEWDIPQMLLVADHWYILDFSKYSQYNTTLIATLGKRMTSMEVTQLVQYMFYANLERILEPFIVEGEFEYHLQKGLKYISIEELGLIAMGCFKTEVFFHNTELISDVISKTLSNIEIVSDVSLNSILKLLRKSSTIGVWKKLYDLQDVIQSQVHRLNTLCLLQVLLIGSNVVFYNERVVDIILDIFIENIKSLRLKDFERITFALMQFNHIPRNHPNLPEFIAQQIREPQRAEEVYEHLASFSSLVHYLACLGHFASDLISTALKPSSVEISKKQRRSFEGLREVFALDCLVDIEGPADYNGYRLSPEERSKLFEIFVGRIPDDTMEDTTIFEKYTLLTKYYVGNILEGDDFVKLLHILPYVSVPDMVFCTSSEGHPVEIPKDYLCLAPGDIKYPLYTEKAVHWNVVMIILETGTILNTGKLLGRLEVKKRLLKLMGYHITVVSFAGPSEDINELIRRALKNGSTLKSDTLD